MKRTVDNIDTILSQKLGDASVRDTPSWDSFVARGGAVSGHKEVHPQNGGLKRIVFNAVAIAAAVVAIFMAGKYLFFSYKDVQTQTPYKAEVVVDQIKEHSNLDAANNHSHTPITLYERIVTKKDAPYRGQVAISADDSITTQGSLPVETKDSRVVGVVDDQGQDASLKGGSTQDRYERWPQQSSSTPRGVSRSSRRSSMSLLAYSNMGYSSQSSAYTSLAQSATTMQYQVGKYEGRMNIPDRDFTHKFPLSLGLSLDIPLAGRLSLSTGLVYSYLESNTRQEPNMEYRYTQQSHYLGLPLNLSYRFFDSRRVDLYATAGGMIEGALSSRGISEVYSHGNRISITKSNLDAPGLLVSFNAGVGVNVNIIPSFGLYLEPGITHYIPNSNHPISYRTQSPVAFNLRVGFKLKL